MITKETRYSQIEIPENGVVQFRLELALVEDGIVQASKYHRSSVVPGGDIDTQVFYVNSHLAQMGFPPIPEDVANRIKQHALAAWTQEVLDEWNNSNESNPTEYVK